MQIFNNGKYKSLLAAESGELADIAQTVQKDKDFRPHFHIAPPTILTVLSLMVRNITLLLNGFLLMPYTV